MADKASTQEASSRWTLYVGKEKYVLTQRQYDLVVEATQRDVKMLHFGDFSISLPYISSMKRVRSPKQTWTPEMERITNEPTKRGLI